MQFFCRLSLFILMQEENLQEHLDLEKERAAAKFMNMFQEYQSILNETNASFLEQKDSISQVYQGRINEIDNFLSMKSDLINQEGNFKQQMIREHDK